MSDIRAPVKVASFTHEMEAGVVVNQLQQQGIEARAVGESVSGLRAEAPGEIVVVVPANQLEKATRIIDQLRSSNADVDWSNVDVGDPVE